MKKSLLALAVLGAFAASAQAQTNVSIGGVIQANVKSYKVSSISAANAAAGRRASNELRIDDDYTSRFWLTGTEDLGGGLSALFYIENRFNTDQSQANGVGAGLANGDTFLGLKGGFGQVTLGKHSMMSVQGLTTEILTGSGVTAMPTSMFATFSVLNQAGGYLDITRRLNSVMYRTPNLSGFSGSLGVAASGSNANEGVINNTANYNDGKEYYLQGGYANGPLALSLAYRNNEAEGRTAAGVDDQQLRFSGTYKFGAFKVGLQADRAKRENSLGGASAARTAWSIPASFVFGNNTILGSFTKAGDLSTGATNTGANTGNDTGAKMYTLGWDHALSKRTNVGVYYSRLDNDTRGQYQPFLAGTSATGSALAAGETASTFAVGVKHTF